MQALLCPVCASPLEPSAKFCGNCGSAAVSAYAHNHAEKPAVKSLPTIPAFAPLSPQAQPGALSELKEEQGRLIVLLVRERLFLYMHCLIFIALQLAGMCLAFHLYAGYIADELTKLMMACTPLLYINATALICIVPIRGTRREIRRLKERLNFVKFQIEYNHLL